MKTQIDKDVLPHLDDTPRCAVEISRRVDCWSDSSIKQALERLTAAGIVVKGSEPFRRLTRSTYRRAA